MERTSRTADEQAAGWFARLRAPGCAPSERTEFQAWLQSDPAHVEAYRRAMSTALQISAVLKADPSWQALAAETQAAATARPVRSLARWLMRPLLAAGALAVLCALILGSRIGVNSSAAEQRYANDGTARRELQLEDGSRVDLDVGSELRVSMEKNARHVRLLAGRAYFQVAHDASRPFSVDARGVRTTALGTEFEVQLHDGSVSVTLAQGSVAVTAGNTEQGWSRRLVPGQQLRSPVAGNPPVLRQVDVQQVVGWSTGRLQYQGTPLREVVEEWNRYARVRIVIADPALGDARVGGTFRAGGDSAELVAALTAALPLHAIPAGSSEILLVRDNEE